MSNGMHQVGVDELKRGSGWFLGLGVVLLVLGIVALGYSVLWTVFTVEVLGWLLLFSGVSAFVHAFMRRRWGGFFIELLAGLLYLIVGLILVENPQRGAVGLTLLIALSLMFGGLFRIVTALAVPFQHRMWVLLNGVISLLLGVMIWRQWPSSSEWVIGVFVAVDLIFYGWSLVMLGLTARGLPEPAP